MKKILSLFLTLSFTSQLFANDVKFIKKGDPAPFTGYVFDLEAEQANRLSLMQKDNMAKQLSLFKDDETLYTNQVLQWKTVATQNTERLVNIESNSFWQKTLFFGLGVLATSALAIGLSKGINH